MSDSTPTSDIMYDSDCEEFNTVTSRQRAAYHSLPYEAQRELKKKNIERKNAEAKEAVKILREEVRPLNKVEVTASSDGLWTIVPLHPDLVPLPGKAVEGKKHIDFEGRWRSEYIEKVKGVKRGTTRNDIEDMCAGTSGEEKKEKKASEVEAETLSVFTRTSCEPTEYGSYFEYWLTAYNTHGSIVIDPNDLWMTIAFCTSSYIEKNAEELRHLFVHHEGKKTLTVFQSEDSVDLWEEFLEDFVPAIKENIKMDSEGHNIADTLTTDFSNTTPVFKSLSAAVVMNGLKHYFEYLTFAMACGIRKVFFGGKVEDFERIVAKIDDLAANYAKHEEFKTYLANVRFITTKFIETMRGDVDAFWWSSVMDIHRQHYGSGRQYNDWITGWVVNLFGKEGRVNSKNLELPSISVPIKHVNLTLQTEYDVTIVGGFCGIRKEGMGDDNGAVYRPCVNMVIFKDLDSAKTVSDETLAKGKNGLADRMSKGGLQNGHQINNALVNALSPPVDEERGIE